MGDRRGVTACRGPLTPGGSEELAEKGFSSKLSKSSASPVYRLCRSRGAGGARGKRK